MMEEDERDDEASGLWAFRHSYRDTQTKTRQTCERGMMRAWAWACGRRCGRLESLSPLLCLTIPFYFCPCLRGVTGFACSGVFRTNKFTNKFCLVLDLISREFQCLRCASLLQLRTSAWHSAAIRARDAAHLLFASRAGEGQVRSAPALRRRNRQRKRRHRDTFSPPSPFPAGVPAPFPFRV